MLVLHRQFLIILFHLILHLLLKRVRHHTSYIWILFFFLLQMAMNKNYFLQNRTIFIKMIFSKPIPSWAIIG